MTVRSGNTAVVSAQEVRAMLRDGGEMALLDVREEGVFSEQGHPFFANSLPLSSSIKLPPARATGHALRGICCHYKAGGV